MRSLNLTLILMLFGVLITAPVSIESAAQPIASPVSTATAAPENQKLVSGEYLMAFAVVMQYMANNMPKLTSTERNLANYDILFYTTSTYYHIEFVPHKLPSEKHLLTCYYQLGRAMDFTVTKSDFRVVGARPCFS